MHFPLWHYEFEDLVVLKNNKGVDDARARKVDYCFQFNGLMYQRLLENKNISFFSPNDVPGLYDAFFADQEKFKELYEKYEADTSIRRRTLSARDTFVKFETERYETGRIYLQNVDHVNTHSPFLEDVAPIEQSNLCLSGDTIVSIMVDGVEQTVTMEVLNDLFSKTNKDIYVKTYSIVENEVLYRKVTNSAEMNSNAVVMKLTTDLGHSIVCTPFHKIFINGSWVQAKDVCVDDVVVLEDDSEDFITDIETNIDNVAVYDITVDETHCFFANGILVHNCQEIGLPTVPFESVDHDENGLISLCTLGAINWGNFEKPEDMEEACDLVVRALDAILSYQDYPMGHAKRATEMYRPLGVGLIDLAHFLAKRGLKYDREALETIDEWAEAWSFYLMKASMNLAKEFGRCDAFDNLKYSKGILPIDTYKSAVDELVAPNKRMPWDELRQDILEHGIRNATLTALMPSETSSQISNSTSGIEPVRSLVTRKDSKDGVLSQVVPEITKLKNKYDLLWDQTSPQGYLFVCAVLQKYIDQSISANTSYNQTHYPNNRVPMDILLKDLMIAYKYGIKNLYYNNTMDNAKEVDIDALIEEKKEDENPVLKFLKQGSSSNSTGTSSTSGSSYDFTARDGDNDCTDGCAI